MTTPTTYSEWAKLLDKFGDGDNTVLEIISKGSFTLDAGTASRFYSKVGEAYKKRKQQWLDKFQRSFHLQNFKTEDDFEIALRNGKQNLLPLSQLAAVEGLPDDLRKTIRKDLEDFVAEVKKSLKDNLSKSSNGREKMLLSLTTFGLTDIFEEDKTDKKNNKQNPTKIIPPTGRKIIF